MNVETYQALGLDRPWAAARFGGAGSITDYERFLNPPGDRQYSPSPEAFPEPDTPRGEVRHFPRWSDSNVYQGTERDIWIYRPHNLDQSADAPALMVFQDGAGYVDRTGPVRVPTVLDTMIALAEIPATVAVFVNPGTRTAGSSEDDQRSIEYDTLTAAYGSFLVDEVLPFVERELGRSLTIDPARRMICGISSGGICAFTAGWFRPDSFGLVLSHCGSFTNIRGGHNYPYLVRTTEPKSLRVFLTSGEWDLDHPVGNWPLANREMAAALAYAGYDYRFEFGEGGHSLRHGGSLFADSVRWLWR